MQFYCYGGNFKLGTEPLGMVYSPRYIWKDLKTVKGAIRRAKQHFGNSFMLYSFTNFYDDSTFKLQCRGE